MANGDMHIQLTGSRLPMVAILGGLLTIAVSIVYATVWLVKLDDRVLVNVQHVSMIQEEVTQNTKALVELQSNSTKQTYILNDMVKRIERLDK